MTTADNDRRPAVPVADSRPARQAGPAAAGTGAPAAVRRWLSPLDMGIAVVVLAMVITGAVTHRFFSLDNARAILASTASTGITAIGATLVMIAGSAVSDRKSVV